MVTGSGAGKPDVSQLIKKDWAMTLSFVLICIKGTLVSVLAYFSQIKTKKISFWSEEYFFTMIFGKEGPTKKN